MKKEVGFYMIYLDGGGAPSYQQDNYERALIEAKRLSRTHNRKAYVLKTKTSVMIKDDFDVLKLGKPDEDSLPF